MGVEVSLGPVVLSAFVLSLFILSLFVLSSSKLFGPGSEEDDTCAISGSPELIELGKSFSCTFQNESYF